MTRKVIRCRARAWPSLLGPPSSAAGDGSRANEAARGVRSGNAARGELPVRTQERADRLSGDEETATLSGA